MRIDILRIRNFRGYKELNLELHPNFNLIIGDNGSGKTALLEALTVAMGSFFLGIRNVYSRSIYKKDIRFATFTHNEELAFPVVVGAEGFVIDQKSIWIRELNGTRNRTTSQDADNIKQIALEVDNLVRNGEEVKLPLLTYYATGRLFDIARDTEEVEKEQSGKQVLATRFRAYNRCLEAKSTHKQFQRWFRGKELARIQRNTDDISFILVKNAIINNLPNCKNIYFEFNPDKPQGLKIELNDDRILPFNALSDGTRNFFAIIADMAYKCVTLNPQLKEKALTETEGIVLIDELDLHLHPEWQRKIIEVLRTTFPKIQFVATTHSPFLIQEAGLDQLIILKDSKVEKVASGINLSIEDIAQDLQHVFNPQWSKSRREMFDIASNYYKAVKEGKETPEMKANLDKAMKPFGLDTAFYAIVEQEKIIEEYKKSKQ